MKAAVDQYPNRFGALAEPPILAPEVAVKELYRRAKNSALSVQ